MFFRILFGLLFATSAFSISSSAYLEKFDNYRYWSAHLPPQYNLQLVNFINQPGPLAKKLREKWLAFLGEKQNWPLIAQYYQPSNSTVIQCHVAFAYWHEHQTQKAIQIATPLWLVGHQQPIACDRIFQVLNRQHDWRAKYRNRRIKLALDEKNILLARQLLNHGSLYDKLASDQFAKIHNQPEAITKLKNGPWHAEETLYALKRMVLFNRSDTHVQKYYHLALSHQWLGDDQQQRFASFMSLYMAMRNKEQTIYWFSKIRPQYYHESVLEWQMRYALLHQRWARVKTMILKMKKPLNSEQTYWLARAELKLHQNELALKRLARLSKERSYYGFLASLQLRTPFSFQESAGCHNYQALRPYSPILNEIRQAYQQKYVGKASQLINDFMLELPRNQQCAMVDWVSNQLNWTSQAIFLSNQPHLFNQVSIRFPVKYVSIVQQQSRYNHLNPEFVYSIIRQESAFHPEIVSPVGAKGLMQLMPRTANLISKRYHIRYKNEKDLFNGPKNIELGTRYLNDLNRSLKHPLLVAAAYNAGPQAAMNWVRTYPAPDIVTWIDTLPWKETRNYLKNIVAFNVIYQHRLHKKVNIREVLKPLPGQNQRAI
jgi:soluble lytic murein transglycosylase